MGIDVDSLLSRIPREARAAVADGCVLTIGNFDGLHIGHASIVSDVVRAATERALPTAALTFEPHPVAFFRGLPDEQFRITTSAERERRLRARGIDHVITMPFDRAFASVEAEDFVDAIVLRGLCAREVHVGYDFNFGRGRRGTTALLHERSASAGVDVHVHEAVRLGEQPISSTRVRGALRDGDLSRVAALVGEPYTIAGTTVAGAGRGKGMGVPTLNLYPEGILLPPRGVYATRTVLGGRRYDSISNLGVRPSFDDGERVSFETMVLDAFDAPGRGHAIVVECLAYLREERSFDSPDALRAQIALDVEAARACHRRFDDARS